MNILAKYSTGQDPTNNKQLIYISGYGNLYWIIIIFPVRTSGGKCTLDCVVCILLNQLH